MLSAHTNAYTWSTQGLFAKAEALYVRGDFEFALVFYHRGNKVILV